MSKLQFSGLYRKGDQAEFRESGKEILRRLESPGIKEIVEVQNKTIVLDSCPFCNSDNVEIDRVGDWASAAMAVVCKNCDMQGPTSNDILEVQNLWNSRKVE